MVVISLKLRHYILLDKILEGEHRMNPNQDDKTTVRHMMWTFAAFAVLGILLIVGANIIG